MKTDFEQVKFRNSKYPGTAFEVLPLEEVLHRNDMDHNHLALHRIEFYVMILITEGSGEHTIDFRQYPYRKGTILTIRKDQLHSFHLSEAKGHMLMFTEEFVLSFLDETGARKVREVFNELLLPQASELMPELYSECMVLLGQIANEFNHHADEHSTGIVRNLLQVLITKIHRSRDQKLAASDHKYMHQFLELQSLIEKHCKQSRSVKFYADKLHVTSKTLNNITKEIVKKTAKALIDEILMLQIKRQLINTNLTIKEIAYLKGFDEPTNFFKFFKRFSKHTPELFREKYSTGS